MTDLISLEEEWDVLTREFQELENTVKEYTECANKLYQLQAKCQKGIQHQQYRASQIEKSLKSVKAHEEAADTTELKANIDKRKSDIEVLKSKLPRKNGLYLSIILGNINVTHLKHEDRFKYKDEYEWFKLVVTCIILVLSALNLFVTTRALASVLHFLLVWYYCTLTIRESILIVNGSRMKGWWRVHHFITTVQAGVIVVWPDGMMYDMFRTQFLTYTCYTSFVQFLQFRYQQGCLYRLRALGERYNMDITMEGFHSWMFRGLSFLIPFLYLVYIFQFYNAYYLYKLSQHPACVEWQVLCSAIIFFILFLGNTLTTSLVVHQKLLQKLKEG